MPAAGNAAAHRMLCLQQELLCVSYCAASHSAAHMSPVGMLDTWPQADRNPTMAAGAVNSWGFMHPTTATAHPCKCRLWVLSIAWCHHHHPVTTCSKRNRQRAKHISQATSLGPGGNLQRAQQAHPFSARPHTENKVYHFGT